MTEDKKLNRDIIAVKILQGLLANPSLRDCNEMSELIDQSIIHADAMVEKLNKPKHEN
jgi:hypothetical protein